MAVKAKVAGLNIDWFPTNFVVRDGLIWYVDYECNAYMDEWSFENWGVRYWSRTPEFEAYLKEHPPVVMIREERVTAEEYIGFLKRTDLGSQYPKERFEERISRLVNTVSISLTARNDQGMLVGALFGLTDDVVHMVPIAIVGVGQQISLLIVRGLSVDVYRGDIVQHLYLSHVIACVTSLIQIIRNFLAVQSFRHQPGSLAQPEKGRAVSMLQETLVIRYLQSPMLPRFLLCLHAVWQEQQQKRSH
jgi:hypothetical protein